MAFSYTFNGERFSAPGVKTQIKSGINNAPANLEFGNLVIIDKGESSGFGGGAGIVGEHSTGSESIYKFDSIKAFRKFVRGGLWWDNALGYFKPKGSGARGVSNIYYIRALTTVAATNTLALTNGSNGGTIAIDTLHEGVCGNGVFGAETRATATITITAVGANLDTLDVVANSTVLGIYTSNGTDTVVQAMTTLTSTINGGGTGYTAIFNGVTITVTAPIGTEIGRAHV